MFSYCFRNGRKKPSILGVCIWCRLNVVRQDKFSEDWQVELAKIIVKCSKTHAYGITPFDINQVLTFRTRRILFTIILSIIQYEGVLGVDYCSGVW